MHFSVKQPSGSDHVGEIHTFRSSSYECSAASFEIMLPAVVR